MATMLMVLKYKVEEILGVIYGSTTRTGGAGGRIISVFQTLTGGKGTSHSEEIEKAQKEALEDLKNEATKLGANIILSRLCNCRNSRRIHSRNPLLNGCQNHKMK